MIKRIACGLSLCLLTLAPALARDFYWEDPKPIVSVDSRFPSSATNGTASAVMWQEIQQDGNEAGRIWLSARVFDGTAWKERPRFAGPYPYAGEVPSIYNVSIDPKNRILVSAVTGPDTISVLVSSDWGSTFTEARLNGETSAILAPRIFVRSDGGFLLFATRGEAENFSLVYSRSQDGSVWSPFIPFAPAIGKKRAFLPTHAFTPSADLVVFQAFQEGEGRSSYQLYSTVSTDRGQNWSTPVLVTGFTENGVVPENFHNQRARLLRIGSSLSLVWERARTGIEKYQIYYSRLNEKGALDAPVEQVSSGDGYCYDPFLIDLAGTPAIVWFDNRRGSNRIYLAEKTGLLWTETDLSRNSQESVFGRVVVAGGAPEVYWQQTVGRDTHRIIRLSPDRSVQRPDLTPLNFASGAAGRGDLVRVNVRLSEDSSGVAGYSYAWGLGSKPEVAATLQFLPEQTRIQLEANADGIWYLGVRAADYAGNWSAPSYIEYRRDTTPPDRPVIASALTDGQGFLQSNSFDLSWAPPPSDDIAGYTWRFDYLAPVDYLRVLSRQTGGFGPDAVPASFDLESAAETQLPVSVPPATLMTKNTSVSFTNRDNGIYALSVAAIDSVGNIGASDVRYFVLNKYIPRTYIDFVDSRIDESGTMDLSLIGRGFAETGKVREVYLDRDGRPPYDLTLTQADGRFKVSNDRLISGITVSDMDEGEYRVGLVHPARGLYFTKALLSVTAYGTVKFGDYRNDFLPSWKVVPPDTASGPRPDQLLFYVVLAFALLVMLVSARGIAGTAHEGFMIQNEVRALLTGDIMPSEKKKRSVALRRRGVGLRFKLAFFTTTLVISVVLIVSIPLGLQFSANQEKTLAQGLESRVHVLLESLASGARAYLPSQNILELGFLPGQMTALDEALNATITGNGLDNSMTGVDVVWATNDQAIGKKIDSGELVVGKSRLISVENDEILQRVQVLDEQAALAVNSLSEGITSLTEEGLKLSRLQGAAAAAAMSRLNEIQTISRQLEEKLNIELTKLSNSGIGSYPQYDALSLSRTITRYVFYKPVLYRQGADTRYVHGIVRVEIATDSLLAAVNKDRQDLVRTTAYIALFAVLMGVLGALLLASIIISPIRKLAAHVAMIRDTEDKESLDGKDLKLRSRDEIGLLGETINEMTHGLVKAAAASKDLTVGKEVQKMFIPLDTDSTGRKLTCGSSIDDKAEFFGYYEGAKGVSGDYFDYIKLDDRFFAVIKCDVAGKGVPAALIMVEVATLFLDYFKDWKFEKNGFKLDYIVSRINDLIESRGFQGRFAAFTLCIFDSVSGDVHFCNAGDNLVHIYDSLSRKMKLITLPESSAAGVFPSFMVDMKGGFRVVKQHLNKGDVLFLYTDGIEEAKRLFRTADLKVFACAEPGLEKEAPHGSHSVGQDNEELGPERVNAIIEAVMTRKSYSLFKWHNADAEEQLQFDFSSCDGTIEETILALVSVEKIFRMYRTPLATEFDRVQVDRKVDSFLNKHFLQYGAYCGQRRDHPEYAEYLYYTHIREDAQYDDLTLLCIRKK